MLFYKSCTFMLSELIPERYQIAYIGASHSQELVLGW